MAAFCLSVLVDGHSKGQEACLRPDLALLHKCLYKLQPGYTSDQLGVSSGAKSVGPGVLASARGEETISDQLGVFSGAVLSPVFWLVPGEKRQYRANWVCSLVPCWARCFG
jgi:hypothetical protein